MQLTHTSFHYSSYFSTSESWFGMAPLMALGIAIILVGIVATILFLTIWLRIGTEYIMGLAIIGIGISCIILSFDKENPVKDEAIEAIEKEDSKWEHRSRA